MRALATRTTSCWRPRASSSRTARTARLAELVPEQVEIVVDERVRALHPPPLEAPDARMPSASRRRRSRPARASLAGRCASSEAGRSSPIGGGSTTDVGGYVAAAYLRGISWVAVPTTLVGQVDAAIGGKTGIDLPQGKNLVGAFHWPERTVVDHELLAHPPRGRAPERHGGGREDGPARRRGAVGAARARARPPLRRVQGRRLPSRPA